jgi:predicted secreted protein
MDQTVRLDEAADGRTIELRIGQLVEICLLENRTTGFRWHLHSSGAPVCLLTQESFVPVASQPGSAGVHRWQFQATQTGNARIGLGYSRPWESETPAKTFAAAVQVTDKT